LFSLKNKTGDSGRKSKEIVWQERNRALVALINAGKVDEALILGQEMVEFVDRRYRRDTPPKATTYNNMGMVFLLARDYELADQCFREALAMRRRIFGADHNEVALVLMNMVQLYKTQAQEILAANRLEVDTPS
jgi:tetratricopeptide (TPR) repeat protein